MTWVLSIALLALCVGAGAQREARQSLGVHGVSTTVTASSIRRNIENGLPKDDLIPREVTVVVPAFKEEPNIRNLVERVFLAAQKANIEAEILIVDDDSNDGTVETVRKLHEEEGYDVSVYVRKGVKGLSTAVLAGLDLAQKNVMLVMDADLQHPPESVPDLLEPIFNGKASFSLGSRNVPGGGVSKNWSIIRRTISHGATLLALPLVSVSDPMSGFFAINRDAYKSARNLNPLGFKIALELMVKCENMTVVEVPFTFLSREHGKSKLKVKTQVQYLQHLAALYWYKFSTIIVFLVAMSTSLAVFAVSSVSMPYKEHPHKSHHKHRKA